LFETFLFRTNGHWSFLIDSVTVVFLIDTVTVVFLIDTVVFMIRELERIQQDLSRKVLF